MSKKLPDYVRVLELQKFLLQFQSVDRQIHFKRGQNQTLENDVEHSYFLAIAGWFISESIPELDQSKVIKLALVHDLVEVYAGDTYIFADDEMLASKQEREEEALQRIKKEWKDFPDMWECIEHYEKRDSKEAKFVYVLDKLMPTMLNVINDGYTWKHEKMSYEKIHKHKKDKLQHFPEFEQYYKKINEFMKAGRSKFFVD